MPFVFLGLGIVLLIVAVRGTHGAMFDLLKSEFTGSNNFLVWVVAIVILGLLGYIRPLRPVVNAGLLLILLVVVLKDGGGFFAKFNDAVRNPIGPPTPADPHTGMTGDGMGGGPLAPATLSPPASATPPGSLIPPDYPYYRPIPE